MKAIRNFFDRHMKTRIAVQLLLDVTPMLLMAWVVCTVWNTHYYEPDWQRLLNNASFVAFLFLTIPIFVAACLLGKDLPEFDVFPIWGKISMILRCMSAIPLVVAVLMDMAVIATVLDIAWYIGLW